MRLRLVCVQGHEGVQAGVWTEETGEGSLGGAEGEGEGPGAEVPIVPGFPREVDGEVLLCDADNIDTDGIYSGKHCYEEMDAAAQARVAMENYDPAFAGTVRGGDVLAVGSNFGCGSSREQAATALKVRRRGG